MCWKVWRAAAELGPEVVQPVLLAVMVSLAELWHSVGVVPAAVAGHSQGEIAAACVAGGLSLEDAARVVAVRCRALRALAGRGGMVSVALPAERAAELAQRWPGQLWVAAVNGPSPRWCLAEPEALDELVAACEADGVRARRVAVDYASHCPQVEELREELRGGLAGITPRPGGVPFYSAVAGEVVDTAGLDGEYWFANLRQPVKFEAVTRGLLAEGYRVFVEASPHPVLGRR